MKSKILMTIVVVLLSCLVMGCGVSQEQYDRLNSELRISQSQVAELQNEIRELKDKYELPGETPIETAENIVKRYHETHVYSEYDFFVCSDMALGVWNMLKAHGINAVIQIGNVEVGIKDITDANHAWVLGEISPGQYLALEATGGYAVWQNDNPLYYQGWSFHNPRKYKRFLELKQEWNIRIDLIARYVSKYEPLLNPMLEAVSEYEQLGNELVRMSYLDPSFSSKLEKLIAKGIEAGAYKGRCEQLNELINDESQKLQNITYEMKGLCN